MTHTMDPTRLAVNDTIEDSPVGSGIITGFSERGYPQVNHITVARLRRTDGGVFDPQNSYEADRLKSEAAALDEIAMNNVADEALSHSSRYRESMRS